MEHHIIKLPKSEVEVIVTLSFDEFEPHAKKAAVLLSQDYEIAGFRKGKATYEIVKNKLGEQKIYEKAAELAVRDTYPKILKEMLDKGEITKGNPPIGRPEITVTKLALPNFAEQNLGGRAPGNEFCYKITLAFLPEVSLPDYKSIARGVLKEKKNPEVSDAEVEKAVGWLQDSRTKLVTVSRGAELGDAVEIDFEATRDGVRVDQGSSKNHPLTLGKSNFLPGFDENLLGMKAGDEKSFSLVLPENWHEKTLAGKPLDFKVSMRLVQKRDAPELNDDFAKSIGNFSSFVALQESVREGILKEKEDKERERLRILAIEKIAANSTMEIPEVLISAELEKMLEELKSGVEKVGGKLEDYLAHLKKNPEDLKKEWRSEAEKRVGVALTLREIAKVEKIEVWEKEVEERANQLLAQYKSAEEAKKTVDPEELKEYTRGVLRNEKVFEFLENV